MCHPPKHGLTSYPLQDEPGAVSLCCVHVGQDLEEQEELLECLLAFFTQYLLANDDITCLKAGTPLSISFTGMRCT